MNRCHIFFYCFSSRCFLWHRRSQSQSFVNHIVWLSGCKQRHMRHFVLLAICTSIKLDKPHWYPLAEMRRAPGAVWRPALVITPCRPAGRPIGLMDSQDQIPCRHTSPAEAPLSKAFNPYSSTDVVWGKYTTENEKWYNYLVSKFHNMHPPDFRDTAVQNIFKSQMQNNKISIIIQSL